MWQALSFFFSDRVLLLLFDDEIAYSYSPGFSTCLGILPKCILVNLDSLALYNCISKMSCIKWRLMYIVDGLETRQPRYDAYYYSFSYATRSRLGI